MEYYNVDKMIPYTITLLYDTMHLLKTLHTVSLTKRLDFVLVYEIYYYFTYHSQTCIRYFDVLSTNNHGCLPIKVKIHFILKLYIIC